MKNLDTTKIDRRSPLCPVKNTRKKRVFFTYFLVFRRDASVYQSTTGNIPGDKWEKGRSDRGSRGIALVKTYNRDKRTFCQKSPDQFEFTKGNGTERLGHYPQWLQTSFPGPRIEER